jgi:glutamine amidotransferase
MTSPSVVIADYGSGNIFSVVRALEYLGADVCVSQNAEDILNAPRVVLPGVGSFGDGMAQMRRLGMDQVIKEYAAQNRPLLGLCVGMQLLFDGGDEYGTHQGLGLVPGWVRKIPTTDVAGQPLRVPHIGWSELKVAIEDDAPHTSIMKNIPACSSVYFVHSYAPVLEDPTHLLASCNFGGHQLTAAVHKGKILGCQFHPERSGKVGLEILNSFLYI